MPIALIIALDCIHPTTTQLIVLTLMMKRKESHIVRRYAA